MSISSTIAQIAQVTSRRDKLEIAVVIFVLVIAAILETVGIAAVFVLISFVAGDQNAGTVFLQRAMEWLGVQEASDRVILASGATLAIYLAKNLYVIFCYWLLARVTTKYFERVIGGLFKNLFKMDYLDFAKRDPNALMKVINSDSYLAFMGVVGPVLLIFADFAALAMITLALFFVDVTVTLSAMAVVGVSAVLLFTTVRYMLTRHGKQRSRSMEQLIRWVSLSLRGYKDIRAYRRSQYFVNQFDEHLDRVLRADRLLRVVEQMPRVVNETLLVLAVVLVVLVFTMMAVPLEEQIPILATFGMAGARIIVSANRMMASLQTLHYYQPMFDSVFGAHRHSQMDAAAARMVEHTPENGAALSFEREVRLEAVSFGYPSAGRQVLHGVDLTIPKGASVAFVGPSGAGKSTLLDVILGLLRPTSGRIPVDGTDIHADISGWRGLIGYISQHVYLIDDTIRANVAFGIPPDQVDDQRVWAALAAAQLDDFVRQAADGLDTFIGENGFLLSGGQRQRLSIARAFYTNPDILIMDEATAALDNEVERSITRVLTGIAGRKTLIYVAHRLSSIRHCDCIYFLEQGRVVAQGAYDELLETSEAFQRMARAPETVDADA